MEYITNQLIEEVIEREYEMLNCRECLTSEKRSLWSLCSKHSRHLSNKELIERMDEIIKELENE